MYIQIYTYIFPNMRTVWEPKLKWNCRPNIEMTLTVMDVRIIDWIELAQYEIQEWSSVQKQGTTR
jgi:hypothetical protein